MMNKNDYINAVDNIVAPESLLDKIEALEVPAKKKIPAWKTVTAVAACFVAVIIAFSGLVGGSLKAGTENMVADSAAPNGLLSDSDYEILSESTAVDSSTTVTANRKIVKTASLGIKTKNYDTFMNALQQKIEQYEGYVEQSQEYNNDSASNRSANMNVKIPADKLEKFIEELGLIGTITSKTISSDDITDSYIDVESRINALETEQETLLGLLEKAENLTDVIELQERLSTVRADLESKKAQKQSYDSMVDYSGVSLDINEVDRVVEGDSTFFGEVKEKLMNNLYDLGDFFRGFAINFIAALPYIAIIGAVAVVVILIVRKVKRR